MGGTEAFAQPGGSRGKVVDACGEIGEGSQESETEKLREKGRVRLWDPKNLIEKTKEGTSNGITYRSYEEHGRQRQHLEVDRLKDRGWRAKESRGHRWCVAGRRC